MTPETPRPSTRQEGLPEAVASATYSLTSPNGFGVLFTVRDESGSGLLDKMKKDIEPRLIADGYKKQEPRYGGGGGAGRPPKEVLYVPETLCPTCGKRLVLFEANGKPHAKCETQSFDFQTKQKKGCAYTDWNTDFTAEWAKQKGTA